MKIVVPSINRAGDIRIAEWLENFFIVVPLSQQEDYKKHYGKRVVGIPDNRDGSASKKRNALLDEFAGEDIFMIDDDVLGIKEIQTKERKSEEFILGLAENAFSMCRELGATFWGFNISEDPFRYFPGAPISITKQAYGAVGIIDDGTRYDERLNFGEDIDFWLQKLKKDRRVLRFNKYHVAVSKKKKGGIADRGKEAMIDSYKILEQKWGRRIVRIKDYTNPKIGVQVPITGV